MEGFGNRLRARAKELGLSDAEVARRLNLRQARYSNYVNDGREPDLATLVRICRALDVTADRLLGLSSSDGAGSPGDLTVERICAAARAIEPSSRELIAAMLDAAAVHLERSSK